MDVFSFIENDVDSSLWMQLLDLAQALSREELEVQWDYYDDRRGHILVVSRHWDDYPPEDALIGQKTDVYLHAFGYPHFTNKEAVREYVSRLSTMPHRFPHLMGQLLALGEEIRVGWASGKVRPGMERAFGRRRELLHRYFLQRGQWHERRGELAEGVFCQQVTGWLAGEERDWGSATSDLIEELQRIERSELLKGLGADMRATYRAWHKYTDQWIDKGKDPFPQHAPFRPKSLENADRQEEEEGTHHPPHGEEKSSTWHRETKENPQHGLRMELERGTQKGMLSEHAREGHEADGVSVTAQGRASSSERSDYEDQPSVGQAALEAGGEEAPPDASLTDRWGKLNRKAVDRIAELREIRLEDEESYERIRRSMEPYTKKLLQAMEQTLEQKRWQRREQLPFGRLSRRSLTRIYIDPMPRLFHKKEESRGQWDARMSVLVDCSASMVDKMERVHEALALFHEVLYRLRVPHSIVGFWEEADEVTEHAFPNYFQRVMDFRSSTLPHAGPYILQLAPQQDNRDGYAIRRIASEMLRETARQRFLIVFSDGQPSAAEYGDEGILDTYEAVYEARRQGIEVIGVYLSQRTIQEKERLAMENIYGRAILMISDLQDLAPSIHALLQRLLMKTL